jgi:hypothetical protein
MSEDLSREEVHQAIDRLVEELLEQAGLSEPPVDAVALARQHLRLPAPAPKRGRRRPDAEEATDPTQEAEQWAAARQIGAHLQPALLRRLGLDPQQRGGLGGASLANLLAGHLLVPACWFDHDARSLGHDLLELKARYATAGTELLAWRLLDVSAPCIITVVDNEHVVRRRSNAYSVRRELLPPERECQRYVHHYSRPRVVQADGWTVQGWPIHRPDWKREILRSVGDEG